MENKFKIYKIIINAHNNIIRKAIYYNKILISCSDDEIKKG